MLKVIQNLKNFNSSHFSISLLHRGQKSKDPYNNRRLFNPARLLLKTLGTGRIFSPRCSRTFGNYINNNKNLRIAGFSSAFILLILSALSIYPIVRSLNSAEAVTPTNSTTSLSITSTNSASVELLVKSDSGTFASSTSSQELNFNVKTDNYAGYELTLLGKDSTYNELKNSSTNTTLTSISGSKESSEFSNGNWGYTLDGTNYRAAPNNTTGYTIDTTSTPNKDTAKTYTLGIGAKANYSTKAGTYTNTYILTAVGNSTPYTIYYKDNTGDSSVTNLPTTQDEATSAINVSLSDTIPTRTGYTFSKWCDGTVTNNGTTCSGTQYSASASFGIDRTAASNVTTLYAVWTVNSYTLNITNSNTTSNPASSTTINFGGETTITVTPNAGYYLSEVSCPTGYTCSGYSTGSDATGAQTVTVKNNGDSTSAAGGTIEFTAVSAVDGYLQDFTAAECSAMTTGSTKKLGDTRDGQAYTIAKLADDKCWMTSNLNLAGGTKLTSSNTDMPSGYTLPAANGFQSGNKLPASSTSGFNDDTKAFVYNSNSTTCGNNSPCYSYYSWTAATLGSGLSESGNGTDVQTASICPKGWRLPTSGNYNDSSATSTTGYKKGDFYKFAVAYGMSSSNYYQSSATFYNNVNGGNAAGKSPVYLLLAGYYNDSSFNNGGSNGYYWSSTSLSSTLAYSLYFRSGYVNSASNNGRRGGFSVRCIKKSAAEEIEYLQDMTPAVADTLATGTILNLKDSRDEQSYTVQKLADGNLWMMNNLNLSATNVDLTSANTNCYTSGSNTNCVASGLSNATLSKATFNAWKKSQGSGTYTAAELIPVSGTDSTSGTAYGTLYNYCATSAGTICSSSNSSDASYDICPKGWRLPTGGSSGEFQTLYNSSSYNSVAKMRASIMNGGAAFALAGSFSGSNNSTPTGQGSDGYYWSSTRNSNYGMYSLSLGTSNVDPANGYGRSSGRSIRCVLNDNRTIADATYMQDVTAKMVAATADNTTATLTDIRDGNTYKVTKINGNLWMTQNLRLAGKTTITNEDSNITAASYTLPESKTAGFNDYVTANIYCSNSASTGCWYNYKAATADTISGNSNSTDASQDICSKGWRLPTNSEFSGIASQTTAFAPVTGGLYYNGNNIDGGEGRWWSAKAYSITNRYYLNYNGSNLATGYDARNLGYYVRCIRSAL